MTANSRRWSRANCSPISGLSSFFFFVFWVIVAFVPLSSWAQVLQNERITLKDGTAGARTIYLVFFEVHEDLPNTGTILLKFPKEFDLSEVLVASTLKGLDGGFEVKRDLQDNTIILDRDGTGGILAENDSCEIKIAIVGNPDSVATYTIGIETYNNGTPLEQGSDDVTIVPGPLDHFNFTTISNQIADNEFSSSFTITARDAYDNNVVLNDSVFFSDNTGTFTPKGVKMTNVSSLLISNAQITKGQKSVVITAKAKTTEKIGMSNTFNVNQIKILAIDAIPTTVSREQQGIQVNMTVLNGGPDDVTVRSDSLTFIGNGTGYDVISTTNLLIVIPGNLSIRTLAFSVDVKIGAALGKRLIDGKVFGELSGGVQLSDLSADVRDSIVVQTPPNLSYAPTSLSPSQVGVGAFYQFQVGIINNGQATLVLDPATTTFQFGNPGSTFTAALDATGGTTLVSSVEPTTLIFQGKQIPPGISKGTYTPQVILTGTQNGAPFTRSITLDPPGALTVGDTPSLQMVSVNTSQDTVTQGMRKPWSISLRVKNNSSSSVTFKRVELQFFKLGSGSPDASYDFKQPTGFDSGSTLEANAEDEVICQIDTTGQVTGIVAIFAKVFVNGLTDPAESNGTQKSILVQTPAKLSVSLQTSQPMVTAGQSQDWQVIMKVKNTGESAATAIFNENDPDRSTRISLTQTSGYQVAPITTNVTLSGKDSTDIFFEVTATGSDIGINKTIHGQVFAKEINSGDFYIDTTADRDSALFTVQPKANVQIGIVELAEVFNDNFVNIGQKFKVRVKVEQTDVNAEKVDSVRVRLTVPGQTDVTRTLSDLTKWLDFDVAVNGAGSINLSANITAAYSANTRASTVGYDQNRSVSTPAIIQQPGRIEFGPITTSEPTVRFGRTTPSWFISVPVRNTGEGTLDITSSQVTVSVGGELQNDYKITSPPGTSTLNADETDTLTYTVTQTGYSGGMATLTAILNVLDNNSATTSPVSGGTGTITVESSALVKILRTDFSITANRVPESQIALVDTGQVFDIEVTVENTGSEVVDTAYVSLTKQGGGSQILASRAKAVAIATNGDTAKATFKVRAGSLANTETFVAKLDSAITQQGGASAVIGLAVDSLAVARIELPAKLQLNLSTNVPNNMLTTGQTFTLRAVVKNLGQGQTDASGKLRVALPNANFNLISPPPAEQSFVVGDTVKWQIQAPQEPRSKDTLLVTISQQPRSKNSGDFAEVVDDVDTLVVDTFNSLLKINSTYVMDPQGAKDRTVSTEQFFTVETSITATNNLTQKTATLKLPAGYNFGFNETSTKPLTSDTVRWRIQAPSTEHLKPVKLPIETKAFDGQKTEVRSDTLSILSAQKRANLLIEGGISFPPGAKNGEISIGQSFTIIATLRNTGLAATYDTAAVQLDTSGTGIIIIEKLEKKIFIKPGEYSAFVEWNAKAPISPRPQKGELTFRLTRKPFDVNTNQPAGTANDQAVFNVTTINRGSITANNLSIKSPIGAQDSILSTGQDFVVSVDLNWTNASNVSARLSMPASFTTENTTKFLTNILEKGSATLSWKVSAPSSAVQSAALKVYVEANDAHDNTVTLKDSSGVLSVQVEDRADPQLRVFISNPSSAQDGVVSVGQPFEVTAVIENKGEASLYDSATVSVDSAFLRNHGYALLAPSNPAITSSNLIFVWRIQARQDISIETDLIPFKLQPTPFDNNTNQRAISTLSQVSLAVRTEGKKLVVEALEKGGGPVFRGDKNFPLLSLKLTNPAGLGSSNLVLRKLSFDLRDDRGKNPVAAYTALKAIRVVNARRDTLYGEIKDIPAFNNSALIVDFIKAVVIAPDKPDTIAILGDIAENATASHFQMVFDNGQDFTAADQDGGNGVVVESIDGKRGSNFRLESNLAVLFGSDLENSFYNYPNPLQPKSRFNAATYFTYYLPEASDGELKIFTLLGELVWETSFSAADPAGGQGGHKTDLSWDGFNGIGKKVLNGVYIAILKTKYGNAMTKVAVVK